MGVGLRSGCVWGFRGGVMSAEYMLDCFLNCKMVVTCSLGTM